MKLLIVILAIGLLVLAYFWMGVALKFLLLWWMSFVFGIPLLYVGLTLAGWARSALCWAQCYYSPSP